MKTKFFAVAAVAALFAASCTEAQLDNVAAAGQEVTVSFVANAPEAIATKAFSDGDTAKNLQYAVYAENSQTPIYEGTETFENLKATVNLTLVTGKTYDLVFWAQAEGAPYTFSSENQTVTVDYSNVSANDETLDAFYKTVAKYQVVGANTETVQLRRPFAQINVGTSDEAIAKANGVEVLESKMVVKNVYTSLNLFDGEVSNPQEVTFAYAAIPSGDNDKITIAGKEYGYMEMNYILVDSDKETTELSFYLQTNEHVIDYVLSNVPVQRNYRTNIYGALLTNPTVWNVEIVPTYEEPSYDEFLGNFVSNATELIAAVKNGGNITLAEDITIAEPLVIEKDAVLDLNGKTISNETDLFSESETVKNWSLISVQAGTLTISGNGTLQAKANDCYAVDVRNGATVTIENGTFVGNWSAVYVREGNANIKGGTYSIQQTSNVAGKPYEYVLNIYDPALETSSITVTGGTFHKFNPAENAAEGEGTNFVAEGYKSVEVSEGVYSVVLPGAIAAKVATVEELKAMLTVSTDSGAGDNTIELASDIILADGENWTPVSVQGYTGAGIVTINGNGFAIKNLNAPLFAGGFAGTSGIVINDLTIADSKIVSSNTQGSGAFIECVDSMEEIKLVNCHLVNSTLYGSRTGAFLGWVAGYSGAGAVQTDVLIEKCSVVDCTITGEGTVGGIVGHAGGNPNTFTTVQDCTVTGCTLTSNDDSYRVGVAVGTANVGVVTIQRITESGNTLLQNNNGTEIVRPEGQSNLYGRFVPAGTGKLTVNGVEIVK